MIFCLICKVVLTNSFICYLSSLPVGLVKGILFKTHDSDKISSLERNITHSKVILNSVVYLWICVSVHMYTSPQSAPKWGCGGSLSVLSLRAPRPADRKDTGIAWGEGLHPSAYALGTSHTLRDGVERTKEEEKRMKTDRNQKKSKMVTMRGVKMQSRI